MICRLHSLPEESPVISEIHCIFPLYIQLILYDGNVKLQCRLLFSLQLLFFALRRWPCESIETKIGHGWVTGLLSKLSVLCFSSESVRKDERFYDVFWFGVCGWVFRYTSTFSCRLKCMPVGWWIKSGCLGLWSSEDSEMVRVGGEHMPGKVQELVLAWTFVQCHAGLHTCARECLLEIMLWLSYAFICFEQCKWRLCNDLIFVIALLFIIITHFHCVKWNRAGLVFGRDRVIKTKIKPV